MLIEGREYIYIYFFKAIFCSFSNGGIIMIIEVDEEIWRMCLNRDMRDFLLLYFDEYREVFVRSSFFHKYLTMMLDFDYCNEAGILKVYGVVSFNYGYPFSFPKSVLIHENLRQSFGKIIVFRLLQASKTFNLSYRTYFPRVTIYLKNSINKLSESS